MLDPLPKMRLSIAAAAAAVLLAKSVIAGVAKPRQDSGRQVFAHYMVGLTSGQSQDQWQQDITEAKSAGIDGFALNIGSADSWNGEQLQLAYDTASSNGFTLFLSFDMAASSWTVDQVVQLVNQYKGASSQLKVNGKPLVSTFEGPGWADNWSSVRSATGDIFCEYIRFLFRAVSLRFETCRRATRCWTAVTTQAKPLLTLASGPGLVIFGSPGSREQAFSNRWCL